jgi:hypothetical protein
MRIASSTLFASHSFVAVLLKKAVMEYCFVLHFTKPFFSIPFKKNLGEAGFVLP